MAACLTCQKVKIEHQKSIGTLQELELLEWKWDCVNMAFAIGLPMTSTGNDAIWVIINRLTKSTHFLPVNSRFSLEKLRQIYIKKIVWLLGIPSKISSARDPRFASRFWESLHHDLGTRLAFSSAYHPQTVKKDDIIIGRFFEGLCLRAIR